LTCCNVADAIKLMQKEALQPRRPPVSSSPPRRRLHDPGICLMAVLP
jgi:hypothetical protein